MKNTLGQVRQRAAGVFRSRFFRYGLPVAVLAAVVFPVVSPLLVFGGAAVAAYVARPLAPFRFRMPSFGSGVSSPFSPSKAGDGDSRFFSDGKKQKGGSPSRGDGRSQSSRGAVGNSGSGEVGSYAKDPLLRTLISKLEGMGIQVNTDWDAARDILDSMPEKYNYLRKHKKVYGFVYQGVIHINPQAQTIQTPIHEYAHVWAEVLRQKNSDEWRKIVGMMKDVRTDDGKKLWNVIKKAYPHLESDDEIADEVLATYSGSRGASLLKENYSGGDAETAIHDTLSGVLERFWKAVCSLFDFEYTSADDVADKVLADLLMDVNPLNDAVEGEERMFDRFPQHSFGSDGMQLDEDQPNNNNMKENNDMKNKADSQAASFDSFDGAEQDKRGRLTDEEVGYYYGQLDDYTRIFLHNLLKFPTNDIGRASLLRRIVMDPLNSRFWAGDARTNVYVMKLLFNAQQVKSSIPDVKGFADIDRYGRAWQRWEQDNLLTGVVAENALKRILASEVNDGNSVHYPEYEGRAGYFVDATSDGSETVTAFDNSNGDCWVENFHTLEGAEKWCKGDLSADEVREMESGIEEIHLSQDMSMVNTAKIISFDENGEASVMLDFHDGCALDINKDSWPCFERLGVYYPTIAEVAASAKMQESIEAYTGRSWAEGSEHEKIFDIALRYGRYSSVVCPQERLDAAVDAVIERTKDVRARAFTPEQASVINLAADCAGCGKDVQRRDAFFSSLADDAAERMPGVNTRWIEDTKADLQKLARHEESAVENISVGRFRR